MTYTIPEKICVMCSDIATMDIYVLFTICICQECQLKIIKGFK